MVDTQRPISLRVHKYATATFDAFVPNVMVARLLASFIPYGMFGNIRTRIFRCFGFRKIAPNVWFHGNPTFRGRRDMGRYLEIGRYSSINTPVFFDLAEHITIGERVGIGPFTVFTTGTHRIGPREERRGSNYSLPIVVGDGVWIGSGVTILPGVTIGSGAVIAACALVNRDVPPNTLVGGVPARVIRRLSTSDLPSDTSLPIESAMRIVSRSQNPRSLDAK